MLRTLFIINLFFACSLLQSCKSATSEAVDTQITVEVAKPLKSIQEEAITKQSSGKVEIKGISFKYDQQTFDEIEIEEVLKDQPLEQATDKPGENFPRHLEFYLNKGSENEGRIAVIPIDNYRQMFAVSSELVKAFDENLNNLQQILKDKNFRDNGKIPFMPFYDATQVFIAKVEHVSFQTGKSLCFLTQFDQDLNLINNDGIGYYCQGITDDKRNYIFAFFPVNVSFLPKDYYTEEFESYKTPTRGFIKTGDELKQYENYISKITKKLENLSADKYEPSLKSYKEIISSLKIK